MFTLNCGDSSWPSPSFLYPGCTGGSSPWTLLKLGPQMYKKKTAAKMNPSSVLSSACFLWLSWMQPNTQGSTGILQERSKKHTVDGRWSMIDPWLIHDDSPYPSVGKPLSTTGLPQRQHLIRDQILGWTGCSAWEEKFWRKFSVCFFKFSVFFFESWGLKKRGVFSRKTPRPRLGAPTKGATHRTLKHRDSTPWTRQNSVQKMINW